MIIKENMVDIKILYNIENDFLGKKICFFDIETTGLSRVKNDVYLIGLIFKENNEYKVIQWMNDDGKSEKEMIENFIEYIKRYDVVINYNGNTFDVPFIEAKAEKYSLDFSFMNIESYDIYREIHKYKYFFGLDNLKQKSIEIFLRIHRDDKYDGGKLIEIYYEYLKNPSDELLNLLLLHNYDDICGLVEICDIFSYVELSKGNLVVDDYIIDDSLIINCTLNNKLKVPFSVRNDSIYVSAGGNKLKFLIPICEKCLKFFYEDYKNYFYLIDEDIAIHKSVAQFVDKEHRIKATKKNCYTKKSGKFLKQYSNIVSPSFKEDINDKISYFDIESINDEGVVFNYVCDILQHLLKK